MSTATNAAEAAVSRVRDIDPSWRPRPGLTAAATVAPALGPLIGIDLSGDVVRQAGEQTMGAIQAVMALIGTLLTIYGRLKADSPISRKSVNLKL